jgi:hypothetical protein
MMRPIRELIDEADDQHELFVAPLFAPRELPQHPSARMSKALNALYLASVEIYRSFAAPSPTAPVTREKWCPPCRSHSISRSRPSRT